MESILLKSEETENVLLVEKKENKYLKQRNGELEGQNKTLQNKLLSTSSADTQLQMQIEENNKLKVILSFSEKRSPFYHFWLKKYSFSGFNFPLLTRPPS